MFVPFYNPLTGKTVSYPEHFAEIKPHLVRVTEVPICAECQIDTRPAKVEGVKAVLDLVL